jgi:hypothetical protein
VEPHHDSRRGGGKSAARRELHLSSNWPYRWALCYLRSTSRGDSSGF